MLALRQLQLTTINTKIFLGIVPCTFVEKLSDQDIPNGLFALKDFYFMPYEMAIVWYMYIHMGCHAVL